MGHTNAVPRQGASREELKRRLAELRGQGLGNKEVAGVLGIPVYTVGGLAHQMIQSGELQPLHVKRTQLRDLESPLVQMIIQMVQKKATDAEIGRELGLTRERARQLVAKIVELHGDEVLRPTQQLYTASEAADKLGVGTTVISRLCQRKEIPFQRRGIGGKGAYIFTGEDFAVLASYLKITRERNCVICNKTFQYRYKPSVTCSAKCRSERKRQMNTVYANLPPTVESLRNWGQQLWQKLQHHTVLANEQWIAPLEARELTGLTVMQLANLRNRKVVQTQPHPSKQRLGISYHLFALSEMKIARAVYQKHLRRQRKSP